MIDRDAVITSRQNATVKRVCALSDKKARESEKLFRFDGVKLLLEAAACGVEIKRVFVRESSAEALEARISDALRHTEGAVLACVADHVFEKMTEEKSPEGVITVAKYIDKFHKSVTINNKSEFFEIGESVMLLESIRDPGNLGTMIRSAAALGIDRLVLSSDCADIYNAKTIRAAMGGLFRMRIDRLCGTTMADYVRAVRERGTRVLAAALDDSAAVLGDVSLCRGDCVVIGNEGHGLTDETVAACDASIIIPMEKGCESLNAAAAAVIFMWEIRRANK